MLKYMMNFYTYRYTDPIRNEVIYIGKGTRRRAYHHLTKKNIHPFVQRLQWIKENGQEPIVDFIVTDVDEEFALLVEEEAIDLYGRKDLGKGTLLNLTNGGEGETGIIRLSQRGVPRKDEIKDKIRKSMIGVKHTAERKQKQSEAAKNRLTFSCIKCHNEFRHYRHFPACYKEET